MAVKIGSRANRAATNLPSSQHRAYVHTLSLRLTSEDYRRLRRFVIAHEGRTGQRITHQAVLETALSEYLTMHGSPAAG